MSPLFSLDQEPHIWNSVFAFLIRLFHPDVSTITVMSRVRPFIPAASVYTAGLL